MMIGQLKEGAVALATDDGEQATHLLLGEEVIAGGVVVSRRCSMSPTVYLFCRISTRPREATTGAPGSWTRARVYRTVGLAHTA